LGAAVIAKVDDAPKFVEEAVALLKQAQEVANKGGKGKFELQFQRRQVAGKPSRLITVRDDRAGQPDKEQAKGDAWEEPWVLLVSELDAQTVLACLLPKAEQAEAAVKRFGKQPAQALGSDGPLQKTALLLPPRRQVEAYLNSQILFGLGGFAGLAS